ncbi:MAG TPA: alpha/beta fold hydrolase [Vicinamibacterales bacterium]|nr:alpha/beta fold hydrolase [Vicinamibacterales bacterium]
MALPLSAQTQTVAAAKPSAARTIDLKSPDGIALKASYFSPGRPGPGILLLHACNRDRSSWNDLATAAAARGFHVLALDFRGYGQSGGTRSDDPQQQQWIADREWPGDIDAAYVWLTSQQGVDKTRIGAAGASCGVNPSLQLARRHPEVRTVVLLSGGIAENGRELLRDSAWMPIFGAASHGDGGVVETMRWAMGWSRNPSNKFVEYQAAGHGTDMFAVEKELQPQILAWLESHVRDAPATRPTVTKAGPTIVEEFWTTLHQPGGVERARQLYDEAKSRDKSVLLFPETETNLLGYQLLQAGNFKDALGVFHLNVEGYPGSANVYDSLSDGYLAMGNKAEALKYAQKALEVLDKDTNATAQVKRLVRESAEGKIKELQAVRK